MARKRNGGTSTDVPFAVPSWPATTPKLLPLREIIPYENNPRTHPPEQIALLVKLMQRHGVDQPIVVDEDGVILKGHGRLKAAYQAGFETFPVVRHVGLQDEEKRALRIADNQVALLAGWDSTLIRSELGELKVAGFDMPLLGFAETQLIGWGVPSGTVGSQDAEIAPELSKTPFVRVGDLWTLGDHRLLCGDATSSSDVAKCLGGTKPHLMVTDPPYGVDYDPSWRDRDLETWTTPTALGIVQNDKQANWSKAWKLFPGDVAYCWHPAGHSQMIHWNALAEAGFDIRMQIIWAKPHFPIGRGNYHVQHEPLAYAVRKGKTANWQGSRAQSTLWQIDNASAFKGSRGIGDEQTGHGTQKPIECMKRPMENNSRPGELVYDPFVGSGTTIIAAEMTARKACAIEIDPGYCEVSIERWQNFTGKQATLDGKTFDEVREARTKKGRRKAAPRS